MNATHNRPDGLMYQTITTPFGLSIRIGRGTAFRTDKGLFIITDVITNEAGSINRVEYVPVDEPRVMSFEALAGAVKEGKIRL